MDSSLDSTVAESTASNGTALTSGALDTAALQTAALERSNFVSPALDAADFEAAAFNKADRPLVVVSVGTDHHRFDRLVTWMDRWADAHPEAEVIIQYGTADAPSVAAGESLLAHDELLRLFVQAAVVVSHGGPSTIMDARMAGRLPIVVARDPAHDEHIDGHQMAFAAHLRKHEMALLAATESELYEAIQSGLEDRSSVGLPVADAGVPPGVLAFGEHVDQLLRGSP